MATNSGRASPYEIALNIAPAAGDTFTITHIAMCFISDK